MARVDVLMPQMGESIAEGTLSKWLKKVGDPVKRDEPLFEISTDKVDAEIPAPAAGVLAEIKVQEGQTVPVQTLVAVLETEAGAVASKPAAAAPAPAAPKPEPPKAAAPAPAPTPPAPRPEPPAPVRSGDGDGGVMTAEQRLRTKSTPLVRKIAAEHRLDISRIPGSGYAGRVTKQDILGYIERGVPTAPTYDARRTTHVGSVEHPAVEAWPGDRVEPWSKIRKITADHMVMSRRVSAHVASFFEVDFTRVGQLRAKAKQSYAERGVSLTFLAFIAKACAENLRKHPIINAAVSGDSTIYRGDVNIGIAVALDWGLIVPVVKHADELSLIGIARAITIWASARARGSCCPTTFSAARSRSRIPAALDPMPVFRSSTSRRSRSSASGRSRSAPKSLRQPMGPSPSPSARWACSRCHTIIASWTARTRIASSPP